MLKEISSPLQQVFAVPAASTATPGSDAKALYFELLQQSGASRTQRQSSSAASRAFLRAQLQAASSLDADLPDDIHALERWMQHNTAQVGRQYRDYLAKRRAGGKRAYFQGRSHALYFLKAVAPTKLVDGAWLYGLLSRWDDQRFAPLIRIYLEELGEGLPDKNHVVLYRKLLAEHGCENWPELGNDYFVQGAIQLALAENAGEFLPEVIGFNLGYEQLPLHLLITAYELNELGIDPYYFTLHVTVDNAATGHAKKSIQGLLDTSPQVQDKAAFMQRVMNGYKLNSLGIDTQTAIRSFALQDELLQVFASKAAVGSQLHSDYCRVGGRTVNDWLAEPGKLPEFLMSLENMGWIKRHQDPHNSRFWKLIHGERAEMFGVFTAYEQQLIYDWIAGDFLEHQATQPAASGQPRQLSFKARQRLLDTIDPRRSDRQFKPAIRGIFRDHVARQRAGDAVDDFSAELRALEDKLAQLQGREEIMSTLAALMSPATHHTAAGLMATRIFNSLFN